MPPKGKETVPIVPELKPEDKNPWGAFINFRLPPTFLVLNVPAPKAPEDEKPKTPIKHKAGQPPRPVVPATPLPPVIPKVHFSISYSEAFSPVTGKPTEPQALPDDEPGPVSASIQTLTFDCSNQQLSFRQDARLAALEQLINTEVIVKLHDSATGNVLASFPVDMLPFAQGKQCFALEAVQLVPAELAAEGVLKLVSGCIPMINVTLTVREPAPSSAAQDSADTSVVPEPSAAGDAAAGSEPIPPSESDLPEPQPFRFVSEADVSEGANVLELSLGPVERIPPGLQAAVDTVLGKDGHQGKVSFMAGIALPSPGPKLLIPGTLAAATATAAASLHFGATPRRFLLSADAAEALRTHLEGRGALTLEVARYVSQVTETWADSAWEAWHAAAGLPGIEALLQEGTTRLHLLPVGSDSPPSPAEEAQVEVDTSLSTPAAPVALLLGPWAAAAGTTPSCLPPRSEPVVGHGGKIGKPLEPDIPSDACAWQLAGSRLSHLTLQLVAPLVPVWTPPPGPGRTVPELIPTRDLHPPPPPPTAADDFRAQVRQAITDLARAFQDCQPEPAPEQQLTLPLAQRHKRLIFDLNRSGAYLDMLAGLKSPLLRLVKDELGASGSMDPGEMGGLYCGLYSRLVDLMHTALSDASNSASRPPRAAPPQPPKEEHRLLALARDYEDAGRWLAQGGGVGATMRQGPEGEGLRWRSQVYLHRAEALHQVRLLDRDNPQTWQDHAEFLLRCGDAVRARHSARMALEVDPAFAPALLLFAASQLETFLQTQHQKLVPDLQGGQERQVPDGAVGEVTSAADPGAQELLEEALVAGHALLQLPPGPFSEGQSLSWALMALIYQSHPNLNGPCRRNLPWSSCRQLLSDWERQELAAAGQDEEGESAAAAQRANAFFGLWIRMLDLGLPRTAALAQSAMPLLQRSAVALAAITDGPQARTLLLQHQQPAPVLVSETEAVLEQAAVLARTAARRALANDAVANPALTDALQLQALLAWRRGRLDEALVFSQRAAAAAGSNCPLSLQLHQAEIYMLLGEPCSAKDSLTRALLQAAPCTSTSCPTSPTSKNLRVTPLSSSPLLWLLTGRACLACEDLEHADLALTESNLLDPELSEPWGLLALLAARTLRWTDALRALARGRAVGLDDTQTLTAVATEYEMAGRWEEAAGVLHWALLGVVNREQGCNGDKWELQQRLARCHAALGDAREARKVVDAAAAAAAVPQDQAREENETDIQASSMPSKDDMTSGQEPRSAVAASAIDVSGTSISAAAASAAETVREALLQELHMWRHALPVDRPLMPSELAATGVVGDIVPNGWNRSHEELAEDMSIRLTELAAEPITTAS